MYTGFEIYSAAQYAVHLQDADMTRGRKLSSSILIRAVASSNRTFSHAVA